eukprot:TRINITY_DN2713_c0_g2_i1.p3 TRINITY_DN2713_c0_g2~~TRINITY_DN2713_c0_g2_i1.p3  ORF type:complete len:217 (+),score=21.80 TRINITY_DN2713_c0_g2_i1:333-983(+)
MMTYADEDPSVFNDYRHIGTMVEVKVEFSNSGIGTVNNSTSKAANEERIYLKARELIPRVCNQFIQEKTGLPMDFFITETASRGLPSNLKLKYNNIQAEVDGLQSGQHRKLNRYIANCNLLCKKEGTKWKQSKNCAYLYQASQTWKIGQMDKFLDTNNEHDDDEDYRDENIEYHDEDFWNVGCSRNYNIDDIRKENLILRKLSQNKRDRNGNLKRI